MLPPLMQALQNIEDDSVIGWQDNLVSPAHVYDLFRQKMGIDPGEAFDGWRASLESDLAAVTVEMEAMTVTSSDVKQLLLSLFQSRFPDVQRFKEDGCWSYGFGG